MNTESDPMREDLNELRRLKNLCPLTPEEADMELASVPDSPLSCEEIERLISSATAGDRDISEFLAEPEWNRDADTANSTVDDDRYAILRGQAPDEGIGASGNADNSCSSGEPEKGGDPAAEPEKDQSKGCEQPD